MTQGGQDAELRFMPVNTFFTVQEVQQVIRLHKT
jgi:hypothetical protein